MTTKNEDSWIKKRSLSIILEWTTPSVATVQRKPRTYTHPPTHTHTRVSARATPNEFRFRRVKTERRAVWWSFSFLVLSPNTNRLSNSQAEKILALVLFSMIAESSLCSELRWRIFFLLYFVTLPMCVLWAWCVRVRFDVDWTKLVIRGSGKSNFFFAHILLVGR